LQRHAGQLFAVAVAAHEPGETDDRADVGPRLMQPGDLNTRIEVFALHPDHRQPPVTGGKNATSSPAFTGVAKSTCSWLTAARRRFRSAKASAYPPPREWSHLARAPTVDASRGTSTVSSLTPIFCRTQAK